MISDDGGARTHNPLISDVKCNQTYHTIMLIYRVLGIESGALPIMLRRQSPTETAPAIDAYSYRTKIIPTISPAARRVIHHGFLVSIMQKYVHTRYFVMRSLDY